jgi:hypothetical protein
MRYSRYWETCFPNAAYSDCTFVSFTDLSAAGGKHPLSILVMHVEAYVHLTLTLFPYSLGIRTSDLCH